MKKYILSIAFISMYFAAYSQHKAIQNIPNDTTEIIFNELDHNFGNIAYKGNGTFEFIFKNTGKSPLIIKHVQSSCGCSVPSWDKQPIPPKGKGKITVKYDTERIGPFIKNLKVFSNAKNSPTDLIIRGEVKVSD
jgi:hypothetical protein